MFCPCTTYSSIVPLSENAPHTMIEPLPLCLVKKISGHANMAENHQGQQSFFFSSEIKLPSTSQHPISDVFWQISISQFCDVEEDAVAQDV